MPNLGAHFTSPTLLFALVLLFSIATSQHGPFITWADSYSVDGRCYCSSNFDHGIASRMVRGPDGSQISIFDACRIAGEGRQQNRIWYNDVICGNGIEFGLTNTAGDEYWCPGRVDLGPGNRTGCLVKGPVYWWLNDRNTGRPGGNDGPSGATNATRLVQKIRIVNLASGRRRTLNRNGASTVVIGNFRAGFAIEAICNACSSVVFREGQWESTELHAPFVMHGNLGSHFFPWGNPPRGRVLLEVTGFVGGSQERVTVDINFV